MMRPTTPSSGASTRSASPTKLTPISQNLPHGRNFSISASTSPSKRVHTFTPSQIKSVLEQSGADSDRADARESSASGTTDEGVVVEGDTSEFAGKKWVWIPDTKEAFIKGFVTEEDEEGMLHVLCTDDTEHIVNKLDAERVNPPKFDKANDMAELTHLNEASVVHNIETRYLADMIYTYSGLFLVAVNPYCNLPIYSHEYTSLYKNKSRDELPPHIYAITDLAFRNMLEMHENQSILVTGESGAGKTENTKKVIQYLAAVTSNTLPGLKPQSGSFEQQILQANPILEAFGNSQTARNNNSSRFGKFIKIGFSRSGQISGAYIDYYLLEKTRVVTQSPLERNYHVFYQLLSGATEPLRQLFLLEGKVTDYNYVKGGNKTIPGVSDADEFKRLLEAFRIMGFTDREQEDFLRVIAVVLHIGNLEIGSERSSGQAKLLQYSQAEKLCHVLGVPVDAFVKALLRPRVKAGRDWVDQSRTAAQVQFSIHALAKAIYERGFAYLVNRINEVLERDNGSATFIGVLDIAGFEIFETNSFEQLCINYTNEKLQQFFNHHMFVLEQEEYARENIEWQFIDFGHDLQPTIDLIEKSNPIGIFSCLDEDCVMPRATDKSFTEKLHALWDKKSDKYKPSLFNQGFRLTHYAAEVDYNTEGWLEKNKDPLNDNITQLLSQSTESHIARLFGEDGDAGASNGVHRRKGLFRTVAQRHKEQLSSLMGQLGSTHPHFVRCLIPNHEKRPKKMDKMLVLDQLRCNGVLEGIRIARTGFPNRLSFSEFRQRYEILVSRDDGYAKMTRAQSTSGYVDGQRACKTIVEALKLDKAAYRVGVTKVFFRAGVLAELEDRREKLVRELVTRIQSRARGYIQRRQANKRLYRAEAVRVIAQNVKASQIEDPWWKMFVKMQPLLIAQRETVASLARDGEYRKVVGQLEESEKEGQAARERARKLEAELKKIEETLESERALALDKEEILRRSQGREADLEEQLASALEDLDKLEAQCEELLEAKRKADREVELWRGELEKGARIIGQLEGEKGELEKRIATLDSELAAKNDKQDAISNAMELLNQEMSVLKTIINQRERQLTETEDRLKQSDREVEERLEQARVRYDQSQRQMHAAVRESQELREQMTSLSATCHKMEKMVERKERELVALRAELEGVSGAKKQMSGEKMELEKRAADVGRRLAQAEDERETLRKAVQAAEAEGERLKKTLKKRDEEENARRKQKVMMEKAGLRAVREGLRDALAKLEELGGE